MSDNIQNITSIFDDLGAKNISEEEKGELLAKMLDLIESRSLLRIIDSLPPEKQEQLKQLSESDNPQEMESFLEQNVPNLEAIFKEETEKLRNELIIKSDDSALANKEEMNND